MFFLERPITVEHIRAFCASFNEGYRVEYKVNFDGNVRDKLPKVLSSFANSHGGVLVVGVKTVNGIPQQPIDGFQPQNKKDEFPLTVENISLSNIYPPVWMRTHVVGSDIAGNIFLVIEVEQSPQAPHAIENSTKVYIRTGNASNPYDLASVDEIFDLAKHRNEPFERRTALLERSQKRFDTHINKKHAAASGIRTKLGTFLQLSIGPRFPSRQLCRQDELPVMIQKHNTGWRGVMFPNPSQGIWAQHESAIVPDAARGTSFFEVNAWGMLFYGVHVHMQHEVQVGNVTRIIEGIPLSEFLGCILFFVRYSHVLLKALGYFGSLTVWISLKPIDRVKWIDDWRGFPGDFPDAADASPLDDELTLEIPIDSEAIEKKPDGIAAEIFRRVFFSVNCANFVKTQSDVEHLLRRGYQYNNWKLPDTFVI